MLSLSWLRNLQQVPPGSVGWSLVSRPDSATGEFQLGSVQGSDEFQRDGVTCLPVVCDGWRDPVGNRLGSGEFQREVVTVLDKQLQGNGETQ